MIDSAHGMAHDDVTFMKEAFREARRAVGRGEVPVGCVVVGAGTPRTIVARGHNLTIARHDPTAHAEVVAIRRAGRRLGNYRLTGATLYVTLEPCLMCLGAIAHARVGRLVYAAHDPKRGAMEALRRPEIAALLHHRLRVTAGVMEEDGAAILRVFFKPRRVARPGPR